MAGISTLAKIVAMKHAGKALPKAVHTRRSIPSGSTIVKKKKNDIEAAMRQIDQMEADELEQGILEEIGGSIPDSAFSPKKYDPPARIQTLKKIDSLNKKFKDAKKVDKEKKKESKAEELVEELLHGNLSWLKYKNDYIYDGWKDSYLSGLELDDLGNLPSRKNKASFLQEREQLTSFDVPKFRKEAIDKRNPESYVTNQPSEHLSSTHEGILNLRLQAQKLAEDNFTKAEAKKIIGESDGFPTILFHSTGSKEPFKEFIIKDMDNPLIPVPTHVQYPFLSTTTNPNLLEMFGLRPSQEGARTIIGLGKVKKLFDYEKPEDQKALMKFLEDNKTKEDFTIRGKKFKDRKELEKNQLLGSIQDGDWVVIEKKSILKALKKLGYDAFTVEEGGAKNIMLMKPNEQFIPIFDPQKQSTVGYNIGGSIKTNPYLRGLV